MVTNAFLILLRAADSLEDLGHVACPSPRFQTTLSGRNDGKEGDLFK